MIDFGHPAWKISEYIREGEISSIELVKMYLERIKLYDDQLNSFITVFEKESLKQAKEFDKELRKGKIRSKMHGIPMAVKDVFAMKDTYTTVGSKIFKNNLTNYDSTVVAKLREAGVIIIGKQNLHELASGGTSDNPFFGTVRNPWDTSRIPGGSSGGSAAAVAASLCAASIGTDGGGSVRDPASLCGIVGLLPTYGRVSRYGIIGSALSTLSQPGPLTKDVRDTAIIMNLIAGQDEKDPSTSIEPVPDYESFLELDIEGLKIGIPTNFYEENASSEIGSCIRRVVSILEHLGAETIEVDLWMVKYTRALQMLIAGCEGAAFHKIYLEEKTDTSEYSWDIRARKRAGSFISAVDYILAQQARMKIIKKYIGLFREIDVLVSSTSPYTAPPIARARAVIWDEESEINYIHQALFNLIGFPAISVPCGFDNQGLPIGVHIASSPFKEGMVLRVTHAYESEEKSKLKSPLVASAYIKSNNPYN